jgi:hypothetical protein
MDLRSPFWDLKANEAGDAFAAEKSQTLALEKPDLKSFSDSREKISRGGPSHEGGVPTQYKATQLVVALAVWAT